MRFKKRLASTYLLKSDSGPILQRRTFAMTVKKTWLASMALAGCILVAAERADASDVSGPVQITSNGFYERGQSVVFDGVNYWLFYGRSATATLPFQAGNPDINDYVVYYKTAPSVAGLAAAPPTLVAGAGVLSNANCYLGETGSAVFGGEVWAFASIDLGVSADVFGWFFDGVNWNEVASMATGLSNGSAHHDEIVFNGELFMLLRRGNFMTTHTATPKTGGWSLEVPVGVAADAGGGLAHFFIDAGKLYMAVLRSSVPRMNFIFEYNAITDSWLKIAETASAGWDPTLFKVGGEFVFAQAPFSADGGGRQWIIQWSSPVLDATFFSGGSKLVTEGKFGLDTWIDMWPIGFTDNSGVTYLFYTSERKPGAPGTEIDGNIWQLKVDWNRAGDHHTYIQEAVDAAIPGGSINVAAGTYAERVTLAKSVGLLGAQAGVSPVAGRVEGGVGESIIDVRAGASGVLIQASDVTVDGFDILGDGGTNFGVYVAAGASALSGISISNSFIHGMGRENSANESVASYGILADAKDGSGLFGTIGDLTVSGNEIHDIGGVAQTCEPGAVPNCISQGLGLSLHEIQATLTAAGAAISGNHIHDLGDGFDGLATPQFAAGIFIGENSNLPGPGPSSDVAVMGNTYANSTGGVVIFAATSTVDENGGDFSAVPVTVLNIGGLATINELTLPPFARSDAPLGFPGSVSYFSTIQDAVNGSDPGATIGVAAGVYAGNVAVTAGMTVVGLNAPDGASAAVVSGTVQVLADGAIIDGLKIIPGSVVGSAAGVQVSASNTTVTNTIIDGMVGDGTGTIKGIHVFGSSLLTNIALTNNIIGTIDNPPSILGGFSGADGISIQGVLDGVQVVGNTVQNIQSAGWAFGVEVTPTAAVPLSPPQNVLVRENSVSSVNIGIVHGVDVLLDPLAAPFPGVGLSLDETIPGAGDGDASQVTMANNAFESVPFGVLNKDLVHVLNASGNWWGGSDPAVVAAKVLGAVDYTPWLAIGTDVSPAPGFQGSFSTVFVDDDSPQVGLVGRIGEGLDLVTGSTVNVVPGIYGPTVVIGDATPDGIVVQGTDAIDRPELLGGVLFDNDTVAQNGVTLKHLVLKGNADPDVSLETIISMDNLAPVSDLTIDNCVLDGEGVVVGAEGANGRFGFNGNKLTGSLTVINSEFRNIAGWSVLNTDFSFAGPPIGGGELPFTAVTFANNSIHDNNGTVVLRGRHDARTAVVDVQGNTWQNIGGNFLQTGQHWAALEVNHADVLNAVGNVVSNVALGVFGEGQALQLWDIGTVDITSNTYSDNAQGIFVFGGAVVFGGPFAVPAGSLEFNTIRDNVDFGLFVDPTATGMPLDAKRNWWGSATGPQDASGIDEADSPLCFDPATMVNADGAGNGVSNLNVDYCPWLLGPVTLSLNPDSTCLTTIGGTLSVTIDATFLTTNVVGGQFFMDYDNAALAFVSADPGGPLFAEFSEFVDEVAGTIDYVVTAPPGDPGTSADVTMAVLTFTTLTETCADAGALVTFRPLADPPTQLSALGGGAVVPMLNDLSAVSIDASPPAVNALAVAGGASDGACEHIVTFSATVTDNCCVLAGDVTVSVALTTGNAALGVPNIAKVQTDGGTVTITGDVLVSALSSCPATVEVVIDALDCCANVSAGALASADVLDAMTPVLTVPPVATIECTLPPSPANTGQATATDNCDASPVVSFTDSAPIGVCPVVLTRTWTATDACGNSTSADQIINVDDTTAPVFVSFPADATIECDESVVPAIEYGTASGGIAVYYNDNNNNGMGGNGENPANRAFLKAQFDGTKSLLGGGAGAPYVFDNNPLSGGSLFSWHVLYSGLIWPESQFGLDLVKVLPTSDGSVPTPTLHAYDNVDGTVANRSLVGPVTWALNDYKPHLPDISVGDVINSLIRSPSPGDPLTDLEITRFEVTGPGPVFTMDIAGKLLSDGSHHWFTPSTPDSPMLNFGLNGEFYFSATLTYDSTGDDGTNLINYYAGSLSVLANSPNGNLGFPLVDDNCDSFPLLSFADDTTGLTGCNGTGILVRTWTTVDACGNTASADQIITVQDSTPPVAVCPAGITVSAEAPGCSGAAVTFDLPTLTDNCDSAPLVVCDWTSGATFPVGTTVVTCNATDACANTAPCTFQVTVNPTNEMAVAVEVGGGVIFPASFTRCITFELWDCSGGGPAAVISETLTFTNGVAVDTIAPSCGVYACVTARDGLHTLRTTDVDNFGVVSGQYVADFTDQSAFGGDNDALISGNLNDDFFIDILDFGVFSAQWLVNYGSGNAPCATPFPHADVNGDGVVNNAELSFIQINFLQPSEANCCGADGISASSQGPVTNVSVKELQRMGLGDLAAGDLNGDGWLDQDDIAAFLAGARPERRSSGHRRAKHGSLRFAAPGDR